VKVGCQGRVIEFWTGFNVSDWGTWTAVPIALGPTQHFLRGGGGVSTEARGFGREPISIKR